MDGVFKIESVDQAYFFSEQQSNIIRYQRKIRRGSISSARKSSHVFFWVGIRSPCGSWNGDVLVADVEELQENDATDVFLRRMTTEEVLVPNEGHKFISLFVHGSAKLAGEGSEFRTSDRIRRHIEKEKNTAVIFKEKQMNQILQSDNKHKTNWKQNMISGVYQEASFVVIMFKEEKLCVPQESSFPIIDVVRRTHTLQWTYHQNVGLMILVTLKLIRILSAQWIGFTQYFGKYQSPRC